MEQNTQINNNQNNESVIPELVRGVINTRFCPGSVMLRHCINRDTEEIYTNCILLGYIKWLDHPINKNIKHSKEMFSFFQNTTEKYRTKFMQMLTENRRASLN